MLFESARSVDALEPTDFAAEGVGHVVIGRE